MNERMRSVSQCRTASLVERSSITSGATDPAMLPAMPRPIGTGTPGPSVSTPTVMCSWSRVPVRSTSNRVAESVCST